MYQDCLVKADCKFDFLNNLRIPEKYVHFTDLIIQRISKSRDPLLKDSQDIIDRVQSRKLYRFCAEFSLQKLEWKSAFKPQDIVDHSDGTLKVEDIILLPTKMDYGCGINYPLDMMTFYKNDLNLEVIRNVNDFEYGLSKPKSN